MKPCSGCAARRAWLREQVATAKGRLDQWRRLAGWPGVQHTPDTRKKDGTR